jgi:MinD-like ATPase involved in chromosome partitioning or flagellar assembly
MSRIVTFYSYKGGVGRAFALANIAVLLARRGKRVLLMDWDLEAPGLHRYYKGSLTINSGSDEGLIHMLTVAAGDCIADWRPFVARTVSKDFPRLDVIVSGDQASDYVDQVRQFSWANFFASRRGGEVLDRWRKEWKESYDFVLLDSRTGITDTGGVCTVFLPDILVLVFSANEQSFERGLQIAHGIQDARRKLAVPRPPVSILPLPGRFDGRDEVDEANRWLDRFSRELKPFYDDWLPRQLQPRQILEVTKVPYVTRFSFGEPLVVVSHSVSDPELPGFYLECQRALKNRHEGRIEKQPF